MTTKITNYKLFIPQPDASHDDTLSAAVVEISPLLQQAKPSSSSLVQQQQCIVLIHGLNGNQQTWNDVAKPLAAATKLPVLVYDQAGHGLNPELDDLESSLKPERLALDLMELLISLGLVVVLAAQPAAAALLPPRRSKPGDAPPRVRFHLFGQSFGCKTALAFAERFPAFVASLALGDLGIRPAPRTPLETARALSKMAKERHSDTFNSEAAVRAYISTVFAGGDDPGKKFVPEKANWIDDSGSDNDNDGERANTAMRNSRSSAASDDCCWRRAWCCCTVAVSSSASASGGAGQQQGEADDDEEVITTYRVLVRPHVGYIHEYFARNSDFVDAWADCTAPTLLLRADEQFTCLADDEVALMRELRLDKPARFITVPNAHHGVHRSHPLEWISIVSSFVLDSCNTQ